MQQAARASDYTAFLMIEGQGEPGRLVERGATESIFTNPGDERTENATSPGGSVRNGIEGGKKEGRRS